MYGMNSMVKDGYWTIKAQEYNDNEEIDEINNRCLTFIPYDFNLHQQIDPVAEQLQNLERIRIDNYFKKAKIKGYV
mgnify:CR=1 FL=1